MGVSVIRRSRGQGPGTRISLLTLLVALFASASLVAHDFWIEPSTFQPEVGSSLALRLLVGENFLGDPFPRDPTHIKRFVMIGPQGETPIEGLSGSDPAGYVRANTPGLYVIGYSSNRNFVTLDAQRFESYLHEEGLERISSLRAKKSQSQVDAKEAYSRCSKSLVAVGEIDPAAQDLSLGLTLELVAGKNPYLLVQGEELPVRLLYKGKPLQGAQVVAKKRESPTRKLESRSDEQGRVVFHLIGTGVWLVKAVHMVPASEGTSADWESFWASLTFEIP